MLRHWVQEGRDASCWRGGRLSRKGRRCRLSEGLTPENWLNLIHRGKSGRCCVSPGPPGRQGEKGSSVLQQRTGHHQPAGPAKCWGSREFHCPPAPKRRRAERQLTRPRTRGVVAPPHASPAGLGGLCWPRGVPCWPRGPLLASGVPCWPRGPPAGLGGLCWPRGPPAGLGGLCWPRGPSACLAESPAKATAPLCQGPPGTRTPGSPPAAPRHTRTHTHTQQDSPTPAGSVPPFCGIPLGQLSTPWRQTLTHCPEAPVSGRAHPVPSRGLHLRELNFWGQAAAGPCYHRTACIPPVPSCGQAQHNPGTASGPSAHVTGGGDTSRGSVCRACHSALEATATL